MFYREQLIFSAMLLAVIVIYSILIQIFSVNILILGSYALFGVITGGYFHFRSTPSYKEEFLDQNHLAKLNIIIMTLSAPLIVFENRVFILMILSPIIYLLILLQLFNSQSSSAVRIPAQIMCIYILSSLSKYTSVGFYFGGGDLINRVGEIEILIRDGATTFEGLYSFFPGLQVLAGTTSIITDLPPYDSIVLLGILTFSAVLLTIFLIYRQNSGWYTSICTILGLSSIPIFHKYGFYFFSQSLGFSLFVFILFILLVVGRRGRIPLFFLSLILIISHHFIFFVMIPPLIMYYCFEYLTRKRTPPGGRPLVLLYFCVFSYWVFIGKAYRFLLLFISEANSAIGAFSLSATTGPSTILFGYEQIDATLGLMLQYPPYIYQLILVGVFIAGLLRICRSPILEQIDGFAVTGIVGGLLVFDTPLDFPASQRMSLGWTVFFGSVFGIGLKSIFRGQDQAPPFLTIFLILVLLTAGPMAAADDLGKFGKDKKVQVSFTENELSQLELSARFSANYSSKTYGLWLVSVLYDQYDIDTDRPIVTQSSIDTPGEGIIIYRKNWANYAVHFQSQNSTNSFKMSEEYLNDWIARNNQVYTTGEVGGLTISD